MTLQEAETIALQALSFLAQEDNLLAKFLTTTGLTPQNLKDHFHEPEFLGGVLDAILADDAVLIAFCNTVSLSPETLVMARRVLPGASEESPLP